MKVSVTVKPGSKKGPLIEQGSDGELLVFVREQAIDGKANKAVLQMLAEHYGVAKSQIEVTSGHTSKHKIVSIHS